MTPCRQTCVIDEVAAVHSGYCCTGEKKASSPAIREHSVCDVDVLQPGSGANVQEDRSIAIAIGPIKAAGAGEMAKSVQAS
jgi:triosephosphate isomerase